MSGQKQERRFAIKKEDWIVAMAHPVETSFYPAIYYLIYNSKIVYVGQSKNPLHRISVHVKQCKKVFDLYYIEECLITPFSQMVLNEIEANEIIRHDPEYNKELPPNRIYASIDVLKRKCYCHRPAIKRYAKEHNLKQYPACGRIHYLIEDFRQLIEANKPELMP